VQVSQGFNHYKKTKVKKRKGKWKRMMIVCVYFGKKKLSDDSLELV